MRVVLRGPEAESIRDEVRRHANLEIVTENPDAVICYGGDGTLLTAELEWPSIPKVPIKHSQRGIRCIAHPVAEVIARLAEGKLIPAEYMRLECVLRSEHAKEPAKTLVAMNEFSVHMARINSAVRFKLWFGDEPYNAAREILGDGFVVSTPFGSTAYFNHITRGFFHSGIGIAFKSTTEHTNHVVVEEETRVRILITRGPAILAFDNSHEYFDIRTGDELSIRRHAKPAVILTWSEMTHPSDAF